MSTPQYRSRPVPSPWRRIVLRADRFTDEARRSPIEAAEWWLALLRSSEVEQVLDERDIEVLTPRTVRRLERALPELAFPRAPLLVAASRRGWVHVGGTTILGLGSPAPSRAADNHRVADLETAPTEPVFLR